MKNLVILTGAGMSAESGISTFRDAGGLWDQYPVEQVATPEGYVANPQLVIQFYNERRKQLLQVKPNRGHELVAELEKYFNVTVITQNVDNLHERAGSSHVIHLHGELTKVTSTLQPNNPNYIKELKPEEFEVKIATTGSKMPVAFMRITAKELPFEFKLTSDMTMAMGATTLADVKDVIVGARISRTGNFMPQAGDLEGETSAPVKTGTEGIDLVIGTVR